MRSLFSDGRDLAKMLLIHLHIVLSNDLGKRGDMSFFQSCCPTRLDDHDAGLEGR